VFLIAATSRYKTLDEYHADGSTGDDIEVCFLQVLNSNLAVITQIIMA
jgi:hypothetical protein